MVNLLIESCESLRLSSDHPKDKFQTKGMDTFLWGQLGGQLKFLRGHMPPQAPA